MRDKHPTQHPYNVGETYRFAGEGPFAEYGVWTITHIENHRVYAKCEGRYAASQPQCMTYDSDPLETTGEYAIIPVVLEPDEVEGYFV